VNDSPWLTVWRTAAVLYAVVVVVLTLLPGDWLTVWAPFAQQRAMDSTVGAVITTVALTAGLLLLAALTLAVGLSWRPRLGPRLRLSWPLVLTLIAYTIGLALIASGDLRAAVGELALQDGPEWLRLAARRLHLAAGHALAYTGLGLLLALGWGRQVGLWRLGLLAFVLSAVIEVLQGPVPDRTPSGWDVLANGLGLTAGLAVGGLLIGSPWSTAFRRPFSGRREGGKGPPRRARERESA
jgi:hypothetical protein